LVINISIEHAGHYTGHKKTKISEKSRRGHPVQIPLRGGREVGGLTEKGRRSEGEKRKSHSGGYAGPHPKRRG